MGRSSFAVGAASALVAGNGETACCGGRSQGLHYLATIILAPVTGGDGDYGWEQGSFAAPPAQGLET